MNINLILAADLTGGIGRADGSLPWRAPADLARFKRLTKHGVVVMGRPTFESLKRPAGLPDRQTVVVSRTAEAPLTPTGPFPPAVTWEPDLGDYLRRAVNIGSADPRTLWVCGGAQVYRQAVEADVVEEIYLTVVHAHSDATVFAPSELADPDVFRREQAARGRHWEIASVEPADLSDMADDHPPLTFITLRRLRDL